MRDDSLGALDLPSVHGKWEAHDDTNKLTFTSAGESADATIGTLTDELFELTLDAETMHLARRSKTATCD